MLHDLAFDHVNLRRHGIELDLQTRRRFIDKVDRLIRQKSIGDVSLRQHRCRDKRAVSDTHTVVHFVAFL